MSDEYQRGKQFEIIQPISVERFKKSEQELLSYRMPLTRIIEQNCLLNLQEDIDRQILADPAFWEAAQEPEQTLEDMLNIIFSDGEIRD